MLEYSLIAVVLLLAAANGANDNFKGVATLHGAGTAHYGRALAWATATTLAGSLASLALAGALVVRFSGKGLVPGGLVGTPALGAAVAAGAAGTVWLASWRGLPVSTTHALTGALVGAGLAATGGGGLHWTVLGGAFLLPLLISPLLAALLAVLLHRLASRLRRALGIPKALCLCIGEEERLIPLPEGGAASAMAARRLRMSLGAEAGCRERYPGRLFRIGHQQVVDHAHYLSAGLVCFSRSLNDTPKIVAVLLAAQFLSPHAGMLLIGLAMAVGGLLAARRVAHTLSREVTSIAAGRGLAANLATALLVTGASHAGLPVSTTHVVVGAIAGTGGRESLQRSVLRDIALAWLATLPLAALIAALLFPLLNA